MLVDNALRVLPRVIILVVKDGYSFGQAFHAVKAKDIRTNTDQDNDTEDELQFQMEL